MSGPVRTRAARASFQPLSRPGVLALETGAIGLPFVRAAVLTGVMVMVGTPSTGAAIIVDLLKNGASIWGTNPGNRPTIPAGSRVSAVAVPDTTAMAVGDYLQLQIVQVGSTTAGSDLSGSIGYT